METSWLEDFLSLVDTGNFSRAAEARHSTQPAFSRRIRILEEWVGAQLFIRGSHPITLTPAGTRFRPVAEEVLIHLDEGRKNARRDAENYENIVRFAATHSVSLNFFPEWLRSIELRSHIFNTRLDTVAFHQCIQLLLRGECHFALNYTHPAIEMNLSPEKFTGKIVQRDRLVPVTLSDAEGNPIDRLPGTEDDPVHLLGYSKSSVTGQVVEQMITKKGNSVYLNRVFVSPMTAVLKEMSSLGRGTAWLPESNIREELESGELVYAGTEEWFIPIDIRIIRSRAPLPPTSEEFWTLIDKEEDTNWG